MWDVEAVQRLWLGAIQRCMQVAAAKLGPERAKANRLFYRTMGVHITRDVYAALLGAHLLSLPLALTGWVEVSNSVKQLTREHTPMLEWVLAECTPPAAVRPILVSLLQQAPSQSV